MATSSSSGPCYTGTAGIMHDSLIGSNSPAKIRCARSWRTSRSMRKYSYFRGPPCVYVTREGRLQISKWTSAETIREGTVGRRSDEVICTFVRAARGIRRVHRWQDELEKIAHRPVYFAAPLTKITAGCLLMPSVFSVVWSYIYICLLCPF